MPCSWEKVPFGSTGLRVAPLGLGASYGVKARDVERAIEENVRIQASLLSSSSPVLAGLIREGKLRVVGGVYRLDTGEVRWLESA